MKKKKKPKRKLILVVLTLLAVLVLLILVPPSIVNCLTFNSLMTSKESPAIPWIGFWGAYLGGLLGSIAALIALFETRHQSNLQQIENDENRRLSVMPALDISARPIEKNIIAKSFFILKPNDPISFSELTKAEYSTYPRNHEAILCFTNIGLGPAFNIQLSFADIAPIKIDGLKVGQTNAYGIKPFLSAGQDEYESFSFSVIFSDILGNRYKQSQIMKISRGELFFSAADAPSKEEQDT